MADSTNENVIVNVDVYKSAFTDLMQEFRSSEPRDVFALMLLQRLDSLSETVQTLTNRIDQLYMHQNNERNGILFDHHQTTNAFTTFFLSLNISLDGLDEEQPYEEQQATVAARVCNAANAEKIKVFHCWWCNGGCEYIEIECLLYYDERKTLKEVITTIMQDAFMNNAMLKNDDVFSETHTYKGRLYGVDNDMLKNKYEILLDKVNYCEQHGVPEMTLSEEDAVSGCYDKTGKPIATLDTFRQWKEEDSLSEMFRRFFDVFSMPSMTLCNLDEYENFIPLESDEGEEELTDDDDTDETTEESSDDSETEMSFTPSVSIEDDNETEPLLP